MLPLIGLLSVISFLLLSVAPGDPSATILGQNADPAARAQVLDELGLNRPVVVQYFDWLKGALGGDLGRSFVSREPVWQAMMTRLPVTVELGVLAMVFGAIVGIPLGVIAALKSGHWIDRAIMVFAVANVAMPSFLFAILGVLVFSIYLGWLPAIGWVAFMDNPAAHFEHAILPVVALGHSSVAILARLTRSSLLSTLSEDYVRTARAKGLGEFMVVVRHALRNALIPTLTILGVQAGFLLGGTVIIESIFGVPGMGLMSIRSVQAQDTPVVQAIVVLTGTFVLLISLGVDLLYAVVNPRIRFS